MLVGKWWCAQPRSVSRQTPQHKVPHEKIRPLLSSLPFPLLSRRAGVEAEAPEKAEAEAGERAPGCGVCPVSYLAGDARAGSCCADLEAEALEALEAAGRAMGWAFSCCRRSNGAEPGRRKKKKDMAWRIFSLKELQSATNNFNYDNKLGEGGFGSVYWGQLWDGSQIAVKRLKSWSNKAEREFAVEVEILARVRHKSLLSLRGYCAEGQERLIVYDYMPNLSIHSQLHGQHAAECNLSWERRMKIAVDSAEGIAYLHHYATPHIIHRDVKASNVLLDSNFQARVADFGFAKLIPDGATHVTTKVKGTLGYLAPEYAMLGKASESCDVFSFGIMLLELASGKKPVEKLNPTTKKTITEWALPLARDKKFKEIADPKLKDSFVEDELKRMVLVGLACSQDKPDQRPIMSEVVELLKGESTEKLSNLENDDLFKPDSSFQSSSGPDSSDCVTEERSPKTDVIEEAVDSSETVPSAR